MRTVCKKVMNIYVEKKDAMCYIYPVIPDVWWTVDMNINLVAVSYGGCCCCGGCQKIVNTETRQM